MLETHRLTRYYGSSRAIRDVTVRLEPGDILGLLGPNGSGKSTTVKMLVGLLEPTSGSISFRGSPIDRDITAYKALVGYVPEEAHLYTFFTAPEYLEFVGRLRGIDGPVLTNRVEALLSAFGLEHACYDPLTAFSKGMRQKVLISAALLSDPAILVLDEPCSGLDVSSTLVLRQLVKQLSAAGKIIVYSSHVLDMVEKVATRVVIVHRGIVVADDSIRGLRALLQLSSLEAVFAELTVEQSVDETAGRVIAAMHA